MWSHHQSEGLRARDKTEAGASSLVPALRPRLCLSGSQALTHQLLRLLPGKEERRAGEGPGRVLLSLCSPLGPVDPRSGEVRWGHSLLPASENSTLAGVDSSFSSSQCPVTLATWTSLWRPFQKHDKGLSQGKAVLECSQAEVGGYCFLSQSLLGAWERHTEEGKEEMAQFPCWSSM